METVRFAYPVGTCLVVAYTVFLALFSHVGFPQAMSVDTHMPFLCDKPVGEDGYYMLETAWNLAAGKGMVGSDGQTVTGTQPLSTLLFAILAKLVQICGGGKWTFVRAIIAFGGLNLIVFAFLIGKISRAISRKHHDLVFALGSGLALFNFWLFRSFTYGLETGIYVTLLAALLLFTLRRLPSAKTRDIVGIGLLAGLCGWARIDFGVVFFIFLIMALRWRLMSLKQVFLSGLVALLLISPWFVWVYAESGTMMPSSGSAQAELINMTDAGKRLAGMTTTLIDHLTPWSYSVSAAPVVALELASLVILAVFIHAKRVNIINILSDIGYSSVYIAWCLAVTALIPVYVMFFWAVHFYGRYTAPLHCAVLPFLAVVLAALLAKMKRKHIVCQVFFLVFVLSFALFAGRTLHMGVIGNAHSVSAGFIQRYFDQSVHIGAFQSGVIGYFNDNAVNLDGKVNSQALRALQTNTLERYIDEAHIGVIVDWPYIIHRYLSEQWLADWQLCARQPANESICLTIAGTEKK